MADPDDDDFVRRKGGRPKVGFWKRGSADESRDLFETGMIGEGGEKGGRTCEEGFVVLDDLTDKNRVRS